MSFKLVIDNIYKRWKDIKEYVDSRIQIDVLMAKKEINAIIQPAIDSLRVIINKKQDKLKAGKNITIKKNVISAKGGETYSAGQNIKIDHGQISAEGYIYNAENNTIQKLVEGFFTISSMSDDMQEYYRYEEDFNWPYIYWVGSYEEKIDLYDLYDVPFVVKDTNRQIISENNAFSAPDGPYIFGTNTYLNPDTYIYSFVNEVKNKDEIALGTMGSSWKDSDTWGSAGNTLFRVGTAHGNAIEVRQNGDVYVQNEKIIDSIDNKVSKNKIPFKYNERVMNYNVNYFDLNNGSGAGSGDYNVQEGRSNNAYRTARHCHMEGLSNAVGKTSGSTGSFGSYSHLEGTNNIVYSAYAHVEGSGNTIGNISSSGIGSISHAEGSNNIIYGQSAHAEGSGNTVSGNYAHAEGQSTIANSTASHTEGNSTTASGYASHAEGDNTTASGYASHAEGDNTTASGMYSHAEGMSTAASGDNSHAEGYNTEATRDYSHAEGYCAESSGTASHAEGVSTIASGEGSHAEGVSTIASGEGSHAEGKYNKDNTNTIHSTGIGTDDSNRKNAFEIMQNGDIYVIGIGGYDGTNPETSQTIQQVIASLQT